MCDTNHFTLQC